MTTLENDYHRTEATTRRERHELETIARRIGRGMADEGEIRLAVRLGRELCGVRDCPCRADVFGASGDTEVEP